MHQEPYIVVTEALDAIQNIQTLLELSRLLGQIQAQ